MALNPDTLYQEANCYLCAGMSQAQALELALLRRRLLAASPSADVSRDGLLQYAACYRCYSNGNTFTLLKLALLDQIAQAGGGSGTCENLEGESSPLNVVTPDFVGQVFVQSDGTIWQAGSLLSSSWTVIAVDGIALGLNSETVDELLNDDFNTNLFNGSTSFTNVSFGNPVTINAGLDMSGSTWEIIEFRNLVTLNGGLSGDTQASLIEFRFPKLVNSDSSFSVTSCAALTVFYVPVWLPTNGIDIFLTDCALNQASVDMVLARCVANPAYITGTVDLSGGTNSPPGVQGAADVITLTGRGCVVTTN